MARMHAGGARFEDGQSFDFGGMWFSLSRHGEELWVGRPVVEGQAILGAEADVTPLLTCLVRQLALASRVGAAPVEARLVDKVVLERGCLDLPRVYLERIEAGQGDSGWFIGDAERDEGKGRDRELMALSVWQLFHLRPALLDVLALPPGFMVILGGEAIEAVVNPSNENVWK
ncbi:hypothetical protein HPC49_44975 [Pyxidicoccus fallax]|uniref:Imm33-like domain-containing protein n=1 Tax=Pyxidicoccus fallax TaxID=394095 RepID=A0A848LKV9_9BACT|nr:hypothetical protein [Pyxidicoccus fallax]NMO18322.1 hypothetical protein [Pyxidicoccus fallax]NPC85337.1 hypothetical protein [Pyxidicoccus fallax]